MNSYWNHLRIGQTTATFPTNDASQFQSQRRTFAQTDGVRPSEPARCSDYPQPFAARSQLMVMNSGAVDVEDGLAAALRTLLAMRQPRVGLGAEDMAAERRTAEEHRKWAAVRTDLAHRIFQAERSRAAETLVSSEAMQQSEEQSG